MRKLLIAGVLGAGLVLGTVLPVGATEGCNSGRGNYSEFFSADLISPHHGGTGPGVVGTAETDCDPGNSGIHNRGGD